MHLLLCWGRSGHWEWQGTRWTGRAIRSCGLHWNDEIDASKQTAYARAKGVMTMQWGECSGPRDLTRKVRL